MSTEQKIDNGAAERLRAFCNRDLIETEKIYLQTLQRLHEHYEKPLMKFVIETPCSITQKDVGFLLPKDILTILIPLHTAFEAQLLPACQQVEEDLNPKKLLDAIKKYLPFLIAHYKDHCRAQFAKIAMLSKMKEDEIFSQKIFQLEQESNNKQTLESEISKLPTRIMRYSLLLNDLIKYIEACEESYFYIRNTTLILDTKMAVNNAINKINSECQWVDTTHMNVVLESINLLPSELMKPILKMRTDIYEGIYHEQECKILLFDEGVVVVHSGVGHARNEFVKLIHFPIDATTSITTAHNDNSYNNVNMTGSNALVKLTRRQDNVEEENNTVILIKKQTSLEHAAEAHDHKAAELLKKDIQTLSESWVVQERSRLNTISLHRGFPSCSIDRAARIRCAITFAVISAVYILGAILHTDEKPQQRSYWNQFANIQLKLFGYFLPFGWVLGLHYQYVVHIRGDITRFWKEFCADVSSWAHIYLIARFVIEPLANIMWPILTFGRMSLTVGKDRNGAASHAIMSLIACGYAMLASDTKWFQWSSFQSMLAAPERSHRYGARAILISGVYIVFLYGNMAFTTTRYYHTLAEFITGLAVATGVLGAYVWSFDYFSAKLKFLASPERQRRLVFMAIFASAVAFVFLLAGFVVMRKRYVGISYRVASGFFVFTSPVVASMFSLCVGTVILYLCHGDMVLALQSPLWSFLSTTFFLLIRLLIGSERALVGGYTSWYVVFFAFSASLLQIVDVAMFSHRLPNSNSIAFIPTSWRSRFQEILLSLLPLFYFLLCLQLFAHFYSGLIFLHDFGSVWWLPLPIIVSVGGGLLQPKFKYGLGWLSKLNRNHEE